MVSAARGCSVIFGGLVHASGDMEVTPAIVTMIPHPDRTGAGVTGAAGVGTPPEITTNERQQGQ